MKIVLIVDHDPIILQTMAGLLSSHGGLLEILTADSGPQALATVAAQTVHIVITGLRMPESEGFEFLTRLSAEYPAMRVIVMTHKASSLFRSQIKQMATAIHFDQVMDLNLLSKRIFTELQIDYGGQVRGIHLVSFLQMLELEECTCTMQISAKSKAGRLYMVAGELIDAQYDGLEGKAAALQILTWENVVIHLDYAPVKRSRKIESPLMGIILESGRMVDEGHSRRTDQRLHDRNNCLVAMDCKISDWTYPCFLQDISLGGAYLETEQPITIGRKIVLAVSAPGLPHDTIAGEVVRRDPKGIGVRFGRLNPQQKRIIAELTKNSGTASDREAVTDTVVQDIDSPFLDLI